MSLIRAVMQSHIDFCDVGFMYNACTVSRSAGDIRKKRGQVGIEIINSNVGDGKK